MGTLTIRTDKQEDAAIEELKALFGEANASKAILRAVTSYKRLKESDAEFSRRLSETEKKLERIYYHFEGVRVHKEKLKELGLDHIY